MRSNSTSDNRTPPTTDTAGPAHTWGGSRRGRNQRGTVLLMVVGILALLSIIAVAYVSIGQSDRRGSATMARAARLDDQRDAVADYILGVIRHDVSSSEWQQVLPPASPGAGINGVYRQVRAQWDYPRTALVRRQPRPRGAASPAIPANADPDEFLVVSRGQPGDFNGPGARYVRFEPSGHADDSWLADLLPTTWEGIAVAPHAPNERYKDFLHWLHISNVAPDGLFVNLGTLRPTIENQRGNFYAQAGIDPVFNAASPDPALRSAQMSWGMTLTDENRLISTPGAAIPYVADGANPPTLARLYVPAHWSDLQRYAFRPARELESDATAPGPNSLRYLPYQWADTDGDGYYDARWFELSNGSFAGVPIPGLSFSGPARLFCAVRIVDLSGLVNLNTATDFQGTGQPAPGLAFTGPDEANPAGAFASDIDACRLLRLVDVLDVYNGAVTVTGYDGLLQPLSATLNANYTGYNAGADGYGREGYISLFNEVFGVAVGNPAGTYVLSAKDRAAFSIVGSAHEPGAGVYASAATGFTYGLPLDHSDLLELLTHHGLNDPAHLSRLEALVGEHQDTALPPFDPLRTNRGFDLERDRRTFGTFFAGSGLPSDTAMLQVFADVRRLLTTVNGRRPLISFASADAPGDLEDWDVAPSALDLLRMASAAATQDEGSRRLFLAYANALAPDVSVLGGLNLNAEAWGAAPALRTAGLQTMFYGGRGPHLAIRLAGFMAANAIDMHDTTAAGSAPGTDRQSAFVLRLRNGNTTTAPNHIPLDLDTAWQNYGGGGTGTRLAPAAAPVDVPPAIRIYGTEAQPLITQVATYVSYADAVFQGRPNQGGASEQDENWKWTDLNLNDRVDLDPVDSNRTPASSTITINGTIDTLNRDFMVQMVAFQLHNPFNYDVQLEGYALQYGNSWWSLPQTILKAGQTRIFYDTNPGDESLITGRFTAAAHPLALEPAVPTFEAWRNSQLGAGGSLGTPMKLGARYHLDGTQVNQASNPVEDFLAPRDTVDHNRQNFVALLWRRLSATAGPLAPPLPGADNDLFLADRLRDPTLPANLDVGANRSTLDRRMEAANTNIVGTHTGIDPHCGTPPVPASLVYDNSGFAITLWGTVRRAVDPGAGATPSVPIGALGAYCLEVKDQIKDQAGIGWGSVNIPDTDPAGNPSALARADFIGRPNAGIRISATLNAQATGALVNTMAQEPKHKLPGIGPGHTVVRNTGDPAAPGPTYDKVYPEIHLNNFNSQTPAAPALGMDLDDFGTPAGSLATGPLPAKPYATLRVGDMLLPMAIGAWWERNPAVLNQHPPEVRDLVRLEQEWTTLSEALALALDFDTPAAGHFANDPRPALFNRFGRDIVDRGNLRLDKFVPFFDTDGDGAWDGPAAGAPGEPIQHPGIPMALSVLEQFRAMDLGSKTTKADGFGNLNTMPLAVLRLLALLSPEKGGWAEVSAQIGLPPTPGGVSGGLLRALFDPANDHYDAAATVKAYREKSAELTRPGGAGGTVLQIDFRNTLANPPAAPPDGRTVITGIAGIREQPGLHSPGELLCAVLNNNNPTNPVVAPVAAPLPEERADSSIDRFARDFIGGSPGGWVLKDRGVAPGNANTPLTGIDTSSYKPRLPGGTYGQIQPDQIGGDYDKKLTVANAVLNSAGVRSDVFCVWFVIQGYLPTDVEGFTYVANADPHSRDVMVPSIQRRYVMVVDRSNVTKEGDKPRILLLRELPM